MLEQFKAFLEENKENPEVLNQIAGIIPEPIFQNKAQEMLPNLLETESGKKAVQPMLDRHATKAIDTWKNNHLQDIIDEEVVKRNPQETAEQKQLRQLQEQMGKLQKEKTLESMKSLGLQIANEKGLPSSIVGYFVGETPEQTRHNMNLLEMEFKAGVQQAIDRKLKDNSHKPNSYEDNEKPVDLDKMSMAELNKLASENPELFAKLTGRTI